MVTTSERRRSSNNHSAKPRKSWDQEDLSAVFAELHSVELDVETVPSDQHQQQEQQHQSHTSEASFKENEAVRNLKHLFSLFDGSEYDEAKLKTAFAQAFDKDATALAYPADAPLAVLDDPKQRVELDFDDIFEQILAAYAKQRQPIENVSVRPLFQGVFEYSLQGRYHGQHEATIVSHAWVRAGKIVRVERMETFIRELPKPEEQQEAAESIVADKDTMLRATKHQKTRIRRGSQLLPEAGPDARKAEQGRVKHSAMLLPDGPAYNKVLKGRIRHGSQLLPHTLEHHVIDVSLE